MDKCTRCGNKKIKIGVTNIISGATVYPYYCSECGEVFAKYVKRIIAMEYAKQNGPLEYVQTRTAKHRYNDNIKCEVCGANEGELHHWAPAHLFGVECEKWPKSYLCRACHKQWHSLVTPNMGESK